MLREHRLYQTDWLMRFYGFQMQEILHPEYRNLDLALDPKTGWALQNLHLFPVDVNRADREMLLRVPGIGHKSVDKIVAARRFRSLTFEHLQKMGVSMSRARYFLLCQDKNEVLRRAPGDRTQLRNVLIRQAHSKYRSALVQQGSLFDQADETTGLSATAVPDLHHLFADSL